jgi:methionyl aminopeptidase
MSIFRKTVDLIPENSTTNSTVRDLTSRQNELFSAIVTQVCSGMKTVDIAQTARLEAARVGLDLSFRAAHGFPEDISVSVGSTIINGIPDATLVKEGDIVRLALGTHRDGTGFSVQNWSFCIGRPNPAQTALLTAVRTVVDEGIQECHPGVTFSKLAETLHRASKREKFHLSPLFRGKQIGSQPIIGPPIATPTGLIKRDARLVPGVFLSFFALGHVEEPKMSGADKWALRDRNRFPACLFSHIVEVTSNGPKILSAAYPLAVGRSS